MSNFNYTDIISAFQDKIGFNQRRVPAYKPLASSLVNTTNTFNSENESVLSTEVILDAVANTVFYDTVVWDSTVNYVVGDTVIYSGSEYISLVDSLNEQPDISASWEFVQVIQTQDVILQRIKDNSIQRAIEDVIMFREYRDMPTVLQSAPLYINGGMKDTSGWRIAQKSGFHGIEISAKNLSQTIRLHKLRLQFSEAINDLPIYIFDASSQEAIHTFNVSYTASPYNVQWVDVDIDLTPYGDNQNALPVYYIGWFDADIGTAEMVNSDWASVAGGWCGTCAYGRRSRELQRMSCDFFDVRSILFSPTSLDGINVPATYPEENSDMVLNLEVSVFQDPTHLFVKNSQMFAKLIRMKGAIYLTEQILGSKGLNRSTKLSKEDIYVHRFLNGYPAEEVKGLKEYYKIEVENVAKAMTNSDDFQDPRAIPVRDF